MATFENPEMKVIKPGEEVPIDYTALSLKGLRFKLENAIAEKLKANETGDEPLTCAEIHELAAAYADLAKDDWMKEMCKPVSYADFTGSCACYARQEER